MNQFKNIRTKEISITETHDISNQHRLTVHSSLAALYAHANTDNPSPSATKIVQRLEYQSTDSGLGKVYLKMMSEIREVYKFDDPHISQNIFPYIELRRLAGQQLVLDQKPEIVIDLGCGCTTFLLDLLKTNTEIIGIGLDFRENINIAKSIVSEFSPEFVNSIHFQTVDLTKPHILKMLFGILVRTLTEKDKTGKLVFL